MKVGRSSCVPLLLALAGAILLTAYYLSLLFRPPNAVSISCPGLNPIFASSTSDGQWYPSGSFGNNETGWPVDIVPNLVHYVLFNVDHIDIVHYLSLLSVIRRHGPDAILIHCNCRSLSGNYWNQLLREPVVRNGTVRLSLFYVPQPTVIYGKAISREYLNWHSADWARLEILSRFGGIYLDRDVFVIRPLHKYRRFEFAIGWHETTKAADDLIGNQVIVANKGARFLHFWRESYRAYDPRKWYYNGGQVPTRDIWSVFPSLVHRVPTAFGIITDCRWLYRESHNETSWHKYDTIHLLMRAASGPDGEVGRLGGWCLGTRDSDPSIPSFDEETILTSNATFARMVRETLGTQIF